MRINDEVTRPLVAKAFKYGLSVEELAVLLNVKASVIEEIIRRVMRETS